MAPGSTNPAVSGRKTKTSGTHSTAKKAVKRQPIENEKEKIHSESSGVVSTTAVGTPRTLAPPEEAGVSRPKKTKENKQKNDSRDNKHIQPETPVANIAAQAAEISAVLFEEGTKLSTRKLDVALRAPGLRLVNNELQKVNDPSAKLSLQERKLLMGILSKKETHVTKEPEEIGIRGDADSLPLFRCSHSGGGRFLPIEPVFSRDEQFLFLALPHCIKVYSTKTSLLHRVFNIPGSSLDLPPTSEKRIVSYQLDPLNENHLFIATCSGQIFLWNWIEGEQVGIWHMEYRILLMEICPDEDAEINIQNSDDIEQAVIGERAVYIVAQPSNNNENQKEQEQVLQGSESKASINQSAELARKPEEAVQKKPPEKNMTANNRNHELIEKQLKQPPWKLFRVILGIEGSSVQLREIHKLSSPVISFKVLAKGTLIALASSSTLWIGNKSGFIAEDDNALVWGSWRFYTIDSQISCMDVKILKVDWGKKGDALVTGYVAIGNVQGEIHLWHNILNAGSHGGKLGDARRLHWHRDVVGSVKLSIDGNYVISGGNETVLVLWQIDTGRKQFLPHLTSAIEHIVISPSGTSYGIRLSDNSVMVLSTTELKPKTNIAGIQAAAMPVFMPNQPDATTLTWMDLLKNEDESPACNPPSPPHIRCVLHPTQSSHLLMATSSHSTSSLLISPESAAAEACPYLQTYDTFSDRSVAKQALTRTHATDVKISPSEIPLIEPNIQALAISPNGEWLASLDEWSPPIHDTYDYAPSAPIQGGREAFLKFWRSNNTMWDLVTRVDSPHPDQTTVTLNGGAKVLDLIALPNTRTPGFATLGADGSVRIWKPRIRTRGGVVVKHRNLAKGGVEAGEDIIQVNWGCRKVIHFSKSNAISSNPFSSGAVAVSNDESVLAVAVNSAPTTSTLGTVQASSAIYIIDPLTSLTLHTLHGLQIGHISSLCIVDRYIVVLGTNKFILFDLVSGLVKWDLPVMHLIECADSPRPDEMFMDADIANRTVSIAVNLRLPNEGGEDPLFWRREENRHCHWAAILTVFDLTHPKPIPIFREEKAEIAVSALKAVPFIDASADGVALGGGYLYLDNFARVNYLAPLTATIPRRLLGAELTQIEMDVLGLSSIYPTPAVPPTTTSEENQDMDDGDLDTRSLVPLQALTNALFAYSTATTGESGVIESMQQAYTMMDISEAFDRVIGLYARPPLVEGVGKEVDEMDIDAPGVALI